MMSSGAGKAEEVPKVFLGSEGPGRRIKVERSQVVFSQGDPSDAFYLILRGRIRLSAVDAMTGKEATVALLGCNEVFGAQCLLFGRRTRVITARALSAADLVKVQHRTMDKLLKSDPEVASFVLKRIIVRMGRYEEALVHQILNNVERRLARTLLHLSKYDSARTNAKPIAIEEVSQELLAGMVGATRSKINGFMTKFRRLGYIDYMGRRIVVNPSLVSVLLQSKGKSKA
jgi:CRP-like cAMP-binding protein